MSPKEKFLKSFAAKPFSEMASKPEFESAIDAALLQFSESLPITSDAQLAMAQRWRWEGSVLFARILKNMGTVESAPQVEQFGQLKHV